MSRTTEDYIEKLKARVAHLKDAQDGYEKEYKQTMQDRGRAEHCDQYYMNSTELLTLGTVIRDLIKLTVHEFSYWDVK